MTASMRTSFHLIYPFAKYSHALWYFVSYTVGQRHVQSSLIQASEPKDMWSLFCCAIAGVMLAIKQMTTSKVCTSQFLTPNSSFPILIIPPPTVYG